MTKIANMMPPIRRGQIIGKVTGPPLSEERGPPTDAGSRADSPDPWHKPERSTPRFAAR